MAITHFPNNEGVPKALLCALCSKLIPPTEAITGPRNADGEQCFACNGHFWNLHQFISGWADFLSGERAKQESIGWHTDNYEEIHV